MNRGPRSECERAAHSNFGTGLQACPRLSPTNSLSHGPDNLSSTTTNGSNRQLAVLDTTTILSFTILGAQSPVDSQQWCASSQTFGMFQNPSPWYDFCFVPQLFTIQLLSRLVLRYDDLLYGSDKIAVVNDF